MINIAAMLVAMGHARKGIVNLVTEIVANWKIFFANKKQSVPQRLNAIL